MLDSIKRFQWTHKHVWPKFWDLYESAIPTPTSQILNRRLGLHLVSLPGDPRAKIERPVCHPDDNFNSPKGGWSDSLGLLLTHLPYLSIFPSRKTVEEMDGRPHNTPPILSKYSSRDGSDPVDVDFVSHRTNGSCSSSPQHTPLHKPYQVT